MSKNNIELMLWGDGEVRLAFWDSMHGEDRIFIIKEGESFEELYIDCETSDHEPPSLKQINLKDELFKLAKQLDKRAKEEINSMRERAINHE